MFSPLWHTWVDGDQRSQRRHFIPATHDQQRLQLRVSLSATHRLAAAQGRGEALWCSGAFAAHLDTTHRNPAAYRTSPFSLSPTRLGPQDGEGSYDSAFSGQTAATQRLILLDFPDCAFIPTPRSLPTSTIPPAISPIINNWTSGQNIRCEQETESNIDIWGYQYESEAIARFKSFPRRRELISYTFPSADVSNDGSRSSPLLPAKHPHRMDV